MVTKWTAKVSISQTKTQLQLIEQQIARRFPPPSGHT